MIYTFTTKILNIELTKRINWNFISIKDYKSIYVNINLVKSFYKGNKKIGRFVHI